jgi:hypothetical protein
MYTKHFFKIKDQKQISKGTVIVIIITILHGFSSIILKQIALKLSQKPKKNENPNSATW